MKVLVACEFSGVVRNAFNAYEGVNAISCDLLPPADGNIACHYQGDVRDILYNHWDLMIAHPPCTYLCSSGLHWNKRRPERAALTEEALDFVRLLMDAPIRYKCIENSRGCIGTRIRPYTQTIQPYQFGDDASKTTDLWLFGLPDLVHTQRYPGRMVLHNGKIVERWSNQLDSGQNKLAPSPDRSNERATTYPGIAAAMADQWVKFLVQQKVKSCT